MRTRFSMKNVGNSRFNRVRQNQIHQVTDVPDYLGSDEESYDYYDEDRVRFDQPREISDVLHNSAEKQNTLEDQSAPTSGIEQKIIDMSTETNPDSDERGGVNTKRYFFNVIYHVKQSTVFEHYIQSINILLIGTMHILAFGM